MYYCSPKGQFEETVALLFENEAFCDDIKLWGVTLRQGPTYCTVFLPTNSLTILSRTFYTM